jgi:hypothetical protein
LPTGGKVEETTGLVGRSTITSKQSDPLQEFQQGIPVFIQEFQQGIPVFSVQQGLNVLRVYLYPNLRTIIEFAIADNYGATLEDGMFSVILDERRTLENGFAVSGDDKYPFFGVICLCF